MAKAKSEQSQKAITVTTLVPIIVAVLASPALSVFATYFFVHSREVSVKTGTASVRGSDKSLQGPIMEDGKSGERREYIVHVKFTPTLKSDPNVLLIPEMVDLNDGETKDSIESPPATKDPKIATPGIRYQYFLKPESVDSTGFDFLVAVWGSTSLNAIDFRWIAIEKTVVENR